MGCNRFFIFIVIFFSTLAFADDANMYIDADRYATKQGGDSSGENFDTRTGFLSFEMPLLIIPGQNGMDISVAISIGKSSTSGLDLGYWTIEVPRLLHPVTVRPINCSNPDHSGPTLLLPGQAPKQFVYNNGSPLVGNLITTDKWIAKCVPQAKVLPGASQAYSDFIVQSPNGLIFRFSRNTSLLVGNPAYTVHPNENVSDTGGQFLTGPQGADLRITSVEDLYGNKITYNYSLQMGQDFWTCAGCVPPLQRPQPILTSITRNDGQSVSFNWTTFNKTGGNAISGPVAMSGPILNSFSSNGKTWSFNYSNCLDPNGTVAGSCLTFFPLLKKIIRPDGKAWTFNYIHTVGQGKLATGYLDSGLIETFGKSIQIGQITGPNGLVSTYTYSVISPGLIGPATVYSNSVLLDVVLSSKTYSGPGLTDNPSWSYQYIRPSYSATTGSRFTYTFEFGPSKMKVSKFNVIKGLLTACATNGGSDCILGGLPVQTSVFPLPPAGSIPTGVLSSYATAPVASPAPPNAAAVVLPTITVTQGVNYLSSAPVTINFTVNGSIAIVFAQCSIDGSVYLPCTTLSSQTLSGLALGAHTLSIQAEDAFGNWTPTTNVAFTVSTTSAQASCTFNGATVASGASVTAYAAASVPFGSTCTLQSRTCASGVLSGTYTFVSCSVAAAVNCLAATVGTCSMSATNSGLSTNGTCASGYTGTCTSSCSNGAWTAATNTCVASTSGKWTVTSSATSGSVMCTTLTGTPCTPIGSTKTCIASISLSGGASTFSTETCK